MSDSERLIEIINSSKMNKSAFSRHIGLNGPQRLYDIINGKYKITEELANLIHAKYLNYNLVWIWTGEGEKYKSPGYDENSFNTDKNSVNNDKAPYNTVNQVNKLIDIISQQQQTIDKDRDIIRAQQETIEKLTQKKGGLMRDNGTAGSA